MKPTHLEPPLTVLLGLPFHDITLEEALDYCADAMKGTTNRYLVTANVDFTTQAFEDPDLKKIVFFADRVVCDGMPLVWLSKLLGSPLRERVAGSDMVPKLLETCGKEGHSVYFLGSDVDTLIEAKGIVEARYPGLKVVGVDSPPIGAVVEWDNDALCERMRSSGAQLLLVCLGCPKQERWIFAHHRETGIPLSIGVGASLDFITGKQKRAPVWMQKSGFEWFWRMSSSPRRLVSRYSKDFVFLIKASILQLNSQRRRKRGGTDETRRDSVGDEMIFSEPVMRLSWHGELQNSELSGAPVPETITAPVLLDASRITFLDSSGLGRLAFLARTCRAANQMLIVINQSATFAKSIRAVRMESLFSSATSEKAAIELIQKHTESGGVLQKSEEGVVWVSFNRSLDALYHEEMMDILEKAITGSSGIHTLVVNLSDVAFIDSRAVGGLIRAWKTMTANGGQMFLYGANTGVSEIISLLRLDKILTEWKGNPPA
jgi:N-acetylglucosaminyldiphosphoundecaprenol N-acetyl-beta-D-mannosaminyltransferase